MNVPALTINKSQARRFLLGYQGLLPARRWAGKQAVFRAVRQLNSIQYDPINVVGPNPHLVLQARIRNYKREMLEAALYEERSLVEGFDKVMCIYPSQDWPYFHLYRRTMGEPVCEQPWLHRGGQADRKRAQGIGKPRAAVFA
ncbi:MAG: winged helix DNA-binding domain-containing protein [Anaerolineales bacterium]|nr:winged helix DNA-binding domain-containing protein [Anaerolineales bacterium]